MTSPEDAAYGINQAHLTVTLRSAPAFDQKLYAMAQEVHSVWLDMAGLPLTNDQLRPYTQRLCDLGNRLMTHAVHPPVDDSAPAS